MAVVVRDARRLSPVAQEDLRRRAVAAVKNGATQAAVSTMFGVSPKTVWRWVKAFDDNGNRSGFVSLTFAVLVKEFGRSPANWAAIPRR